MGTLMRNKEGVNGCLPGTCCQKIGDLAWQQASGTQYIVLVMDVSIDGRRTLFHFFYIRNQ